VKKTKKHTHACNLGDPVGSRRTSIGKKVSPLHKGADRRALSEIYDKYYKDQVSALYRAVID
jgi:hypothetical protein